MMKKYLKKLLPHFLLEWKNRKMCLAELKRENLFYNDKAIHFSSTTANNRSAQLAKMMIETHTLEKGITMPERRYGFGQDLVRHMISHCNVVIRQWGGSFVEVQAALVALKQYRDIHVKANVDIPDDIAVGIDVLLPNLTTTNGECYRIRKEDFFKSTDDFSKFAASRHSVRWFADTPVDEEKLMAAIRLSQTAPSACNRQSVRVKIISSPESKNLCCKFQNGNRGFGQSADKWLLVTFELNNWSYKQIEMGFIDAGIFTMNLLYALHYYGIGACALNAHIDIDNRKLLQQGLGFLESEIPAVFIVIGNPMEEFMLCRSPRLNVESIVQKI